MEHRVIIEKLCSCAKREGMDRIVTFGTKNDAAKAAEEQLAYIQQNFCGKHSFDITEVEERNVIGMFGGCGCGSRDEH